MTRYALFDFANTLADLLPSRTQVMHNYIYSCCGLCVDDASIARAYQAVDLIMPYSSVQIQTSNRRHDFYHEYNNQLLNFLGVSHLTDPKALFQAFQGKKRHWILKPNVLRILAELRNKGWSIGIISNFDESLERLVHQELVMTDLIDVLHISQVEGIEKPNARFFQSFLERYGVDIENSFYVGDSYSLDFLPAISLGLRAWLLDELGYYSHLPQSIRSLDDVLAFTSPRASN